MSEDSYAGDLALVGGMFMAVMALMAALILSTTPASGDDSVQEDTPAGATIIEIERYREVGVFTETVVYVETLRLQDGDWISLCRSSVPLYVNQRSGVPIAAPHCVRISAGEAEKLTSR